MKCAPPGVGRGARAILEKLDLAITALAASPQPVVDPRKIQIAGTTLRRASPELHHERNPDEKLKVTLFRLDERL